MSVSVLMRDTTLTGEIMRELRVALESELTTVGGLIAARVRAEVAAHNQRVAEQGAEAEAPPEPRSALAQWDRRPVDAEREIAAALQAFGRKAYLVLVDREQCDDAECEVLIAPEATVSFLKIVPLIGG
ncbi:MAG TPA: hypothetical protein VGE07_08115 [Herpetosiphonaceae bacterium]